MSTVESGFLDHAGEADGGVLHSINQYGFLFTWRDIRLSDIYSSYEAKPNTWVYNR